MNITVRLTKIKLEILNELQKRDERYRKDLMEKIRTDTQEDYPGNK